MNIFCKLKKTYLWYLGRKPIASFTVESYDEMIEFLDSNCRRVDRKSRINFGFVGYLSEGFFYYEHRGDIYLKHEALLFKSTWYFRGKLENTDCGSCMTGSFRVFPVLELMSTFVLLVAAFGSTSIFRMPSFGQSLSVLDVSVVLIGLPAFLLAVRLMLKPIPYVGGRSVSSVSELFEKYKAKK